MIVSKQIIICATTLLMLLNHVSAFFWSSGETNNRAKIYSGSGNAVLHTTVWRSEHSHPRTQNPYYIYQRRMPPSYNIPYSEPNLPAVPMQVPLQAQLSPQPTVQNVQLVPCLCPIQTDFEQVKPENFYLSPPSHHAPPPNNGNQVKNVQN